jgi:hypothetical protein
MLIIPPPLSNNERQARFRARNPGYNRRYRDRTNPAEVQAAILKAQADAQAMEQNITSTNQTPADGDQLLLFPV